MVRKRGVFYASTGDNSSEFASRVENSSNIDYVSGEALLGY